MLERPSLSDESIRSVLRADFGLEAALVKFLPIGNDATTWVYRVQAGDGRAYFLKVKAGTVYAPSVSVPRYLRDQGLEQVVAPLPTTAGALWAPAGGFALSLYPFIEGQTGMDKGLSARQWTELGAVLARVHATRLPSELGAQVQAETFVPRWGGMVRALQARIAAGKYSGAAARALAGFWLERQALISQIVETTDALGQWLRASPPEFGLCHTDIHTANVLLDPDGRLFIVDWDAPLLAPKERDLMFVVGSAASDNAPFFRGYGPAQVDALALAYYRYEWVVQEIGDFGERVFLAPDAGEVTRQAAAQGFRDLFRPGDVVEAAVGGDATRRMTGDE